jgi:hypothetical protein
MKLKAQNSPILFGFLDTLGGVGEVLKLRLPDGQTLAGARRPVSRMSVSEYRNLYLKPKQTAITSSQARR